VIEPNDTVHRYELLERREQVGEVSRYRLFEDQARANRNRLRKQVFRVPDDERIYAYGASTRGSTLLQFSGEDVIERIAAAVDRNPEKVGKKWGGLGVDIISEQEARAAPPEWMLITPWFYREQILQREHRMLEQGTKAIIPLPVCHVVDRARVAA
jgi:FlaA1/EpsC-like NDP-sugar epimerase